MTGANPPNRHPPCSLEGNLARLAGLLGEVDLRVELDGGRVGLQRPHLGERLYRGEVAAVRACPKGRLQSPPLAGEERNTMGLNTPPSSGRRSVG